MTLVNSSSTIPRRFDRALWLAILLAIVLLIPRGYLISRAQSERVDDEYHLIRGVHFLDGTLVKSKLALNDPPLGEAITALPLWLAGCWTRSSIDGSALFGQKYSANAILDVIALWKTLLFLPMVGVVFAWVRRIYSSRAAWLAIAILLIEPNFAAHIPLPTLDVLGVEGIVIASYFIWRYVDSPNWRGVVIAAVAMAIAMLLKHTAILLPGVALVMAALYWRFKHPTPLPGTPGGGGVGGSDFENAPAAQTEEPPTEPPPGVPGRGVRLAQLIAATMIVPFVMWALCGFDFSKPRIPETAPGSPSWTADHPYLTKLVRHHLPAGVYVASFLQGSWHSGVGHPAYLFGERRRTGWWYYFPVISTYKVPIGIGAVMVLSLVSLLKIRPKFDELSLLVPMVAWTGMMMASKIDIGFRHFLPAYAFMLMLATRVMLLRAPAFSFAWQPMAWIGVAVAAIHVSMFHPEYITYINFPRHDVWRQISDSNVDWGEGLKLARKWVDAHLDREIFMRDFGWGDPRRTVDVQHRLGKRVHILDRDATLPRGGILIISPVPLVGVYERYDPFSTLRKFEPIAILGNALRVYDLDALRGNKPFKWPKMPVRIANEAAIKKPVKKVKKRATTRAATSSVASGQ